MRGTADPRGSASGGSQVQNPAYRVSGTTGESTLNAFTTQVGSFSHMALQSKVTSIHLCGLKLNESAGAQSKGHSHDVLGDYLNTKLSNNFASPMCVRMRVKHRFHPAQESHRNRRQNTCLFDATVDMVTYDEENNSVRSPPFRSHTKIIYSLEYATNLPRTSLSLISGCSRR